MPLFDVDSDRASTTPFVTELCMRMTLVSFMNEQMIYQMGEIGRHMFIISNGKVEVLDNARKDVMCVLEAGAYFGEDSSWRCAKAGEPWALRATCSLRYYARTSTCSWTLPAHAAASTRLVLQAQGAV